jgi:pantoate--beta-alanine ligase
MNTHVDIQEWIARRRMLSGESIGFVPTMGALHEGHLSLVRRSIVENRHTVVSLFVNPAQFDSQRDLETYPRHLESDVASLQEEGADTLLLPKKESIYPDHGNYGVSEQRLSKLFCGAHRPGHFEGVLNVVLRLLNIVRPDRAYFGEKDWQQLELIRGMVEAFFMGVEIVACPTVREADGLAMSSRNLLLSAEQRRVAPLLYAELKRQGSPQQSRRRLEEQGFEVDYISSHGSRRLVAASLGTIRLIDNVQSR